MYSSLYAGYCYGKVLVPIDNYFLFCFCFYNCNWSLRWNLKPSLVTLVVVREVSKIIGACKYQRPWEGEGGVIGREEARHFPVCNKLYMTLGVYIWNVLPGAEQYWRCPYHLASVFSTESTSCSHFSSNSPVKPLDLFVRYIIIQASTHI